MPLYNEKHSLVLSLPPILTRSSAESLTLPLAISPLSACMPMLFSFSAAAIAQASMDPYAASPKAYMASPAHITAAAFRSMDTSAFSYASRKAVGPGTLAASRLTMTLSVSASPPPSILSQAASSSGSRPRPPTSSLSAELYSIML